MNHAPAKYVAIKRFVYSKAKRTLQPTFQFVRATPEIEAEHGSYDLPHMSSAELKRASRSKYLPHVGAKQTSKAHV